MNRLRCLLAVILWARLDAITIQTNVDTEEPSVIKSPAMGAADYFGWTALFHQIEEVNPSSDGMAQTLAKTRVVIGAPKGSYPGGLTIPDPADPGLPAEAETGLVYSCPIGPGTCEGVLGDRSLYTASERDANGVFNYTFETFDFFPSAVAEGRLFDQAPNSVADPRDGFPDFQFERKDGQLMGAHLFSNGDRLLACAPLWTVSLDKDEPRGICYIGMRNLSNFSTVVASASGGDSFVFSASGVSGVVTENSIHIGVPGYSDGSGSVLARTLSVALTIPFHSLIPATGFTEYAGFQMELGYIRSNDRSSGEPDIAVSSPRHDGNANYTGRIFVYSTAVVLPLMIVPPEEIDADISSQLIVGSQGAEFFGHSLALLDLTGDGFDDLVVGAPMYSSLGVVSLELSEPLMVERGRIYIFINIGGSFDTDNPIVLPGFKERGRFGFAVATVGDLDADGHEDFVVGAPYEGSDDSANTGAVYVYYGRNTREEIAAQSPQRVHADDVVASVSTLNRLRGFGFSVSGKIDVDQNKHSDIVVGAPYDSTVVVLRTLPFVNVTVDIESVPPVNVDTNPSFSVRVRASYTSATAISSTLEVPFTLTEQVLGEEPRLFFTRDIIADSVGEGVFSFTGPDTDTVAVVQVFTTQDISQLAPYELLVNLVDKRENLSQVTGNQEISDLSLAPRLRLDGNNTLSVNITDPCGDNVCESDVVLRPVEPSQAILVAGNRAAIEFVITYTNMEREDGRNLMLNITQIPSNYLSPSSVTLIAPDRTFSCQDTPDGAYVSCTLQNRIQSNATLTATLAFTPTASFIGNENDFTVSLELVVNSTGGNMDVDTSNNRQGILFSFDSEANIRVLDIAFSPTNVYQYTSTSPTDLMIAGSDDLGTVGDLRVRILNEGPSTIQAARVDIDFPARLSDITGDRYFLYPSSLDISSGLNTVVDCSASADQLDPDMRDETAPITSSNRRKRSAPVKIATRRSRRNTHTETTIEKRQANVDANAVVFNCSSASDQCVTISCTIQKLTIEIVTLNLIFNLDQRFYGPDGNSRRFSLGATATVAVTTDFQIADDDVTDNSAIANATVQPEIIEAENDPNLIHAIIWPIVVGVIIIVILFIVLIRVGFFRRKKKPGEEEIEGDHSEKVPQPLVQEVQEPLVQEVPEKPPYAEGEATTV